MPTVTATSVAADRGVEPAGKAAVTVMSTAPSASPTAAGSTLRSMEEGAESLARMVISAALTGNPAAPDTMMVSSPSAVLSSVTVRSKAASPLAAPAARVRSKSSTAVKSPVPAGLPPPPATDTVTVMPSNRYWMSTALYPYT